MDEARLDNAAARAARAAEDALRHDRRSAGPGYGGLRLPGTCTSDLGPRPAYSAEADERILGNCGLMGVCDESGARMSGEYALRSMASMHDRGNGLGGGFAGYGIYPHLPHAFCFHMLFADEIGKEDTEYYFARHFVIIQHEPVPTRSVKGIEDEPIIWRYFLEISDERLAETQLSAEDYVVHAVMDINAYINGAFVASSGRNMGVFKGVGFPEEIGEFYRLDEYQGWTWTGHGRFPTNTPGWWGGAHPFGLIDYTVVHNGEISSYGINRRYLEMFGYQCSLRTDTEVVTYLFDLMPDEERRLYTALRAVYGPALLNGPFAVVLGMAEGMVALNDRIKLRPLVAARKGSTVYVASEESAIREICPRPDRSWMPRAGEPVVARLQPPADLSAAGQQEAVVAA